MESSTLIISCPTCGKSLPWTTEQRWRPFCSERCRLIDLGAWADESHRLPVQPDAALDFIDDEQPHPDSFTDPTKS